MAYEDIACRCFLCDCSGRAGRHNSRPAEPTTPTSKVLPQLSTPKVLVAEEETSETGNKSRQSSFRAASSISFDGQTPEPASRINSAVSGGESASACVAFAIENTSSMESCSVQTSVEQDTSTVLPYKELRVSGNWLSITVVPPRVFVMSECLCLLFMCCFGCGW